MVHSNDRSTVPTAILGCDVHRPYYSFVQSMLEADLLTHEELASALGPRLSAGFQRFTQSIRVERSSGSMCLEIEDTETLSDSFFRFAWIEDSEPLLVIMSPTSLDPTWSICAAGIAKSSVLQCFCSCHWPTLHASFPLIGVPRVEWCDWFSPFICSFLQELIKMFAAYEPTHSVVRLRAASSR